MDNPVCFKAVINENSHTLILGSMPGKVSLTEVQYYAHPRNGFWHIMGNLFGAGPDKPYQKRLAILLDNGIALWDVIEQCSRSTSLDSDIEEQSIIPNDFHSLLSKHKKIDRIFFNGGKAEQSFKRYVHPLLGEQLKNIRCVGLTSTSPANARYSIDEKIVMWQKSIMGTVE